MCQSASRWVLLGVLSATCVSLTPSPPIFMLRTLLVERFRVCSWSVVYFG